MNFFSYIKLWIKIVWNYVLTWEFQVVLSIYYYAIFSPKTWHFKQIFYFITILGFVWPSDSFATLFIGWGWSKMASLTWLAVGAGCWPDVQSGPISQGSWFFSMWAALCGKLFFFTAIKQHQLCHILLIKSNKSANSDLNGGEGVLPL